MIYQQKDGNQEDPVNASYILGASNTIKVKFDFSVPLIPENYLVPITTKIELMDSDLNSIADPIDPQTVNIPWAGFNTAPITTYGFLYYETTFTVNGNIDDSSLLEKYLKKCRTIYSVKGGDDGPKQFLTFNSIHISVNKRHLVMRKYIILNRQP